MQDRGIVSGSVRQNVVWRTSLQSMFCVNLSQMFLRSILEFFLFFNNTLQGCKRKKFNHFHFFCFRKTFCRKGVSQISLGCVETEPCSCLPQSFISSSYLFVCACMRCQGVSDDLGMLWLQGNSGCLPSRYCDLSLLILFFVCGFSR